VRQRFEAREGREPTLEELARAAGMNLLHAPEAVEAVEAGVSLNQTIGDEAGELGDLFADPESVDPVEEAAQSLRGDAVREALSALPERQRRIVELRFGFEGEVLSLEAIGRELGLTRERVRQLEQDALARLSGELKGLALATSDELADAA
jgi:RNA polymerase primary sigma factor